MKQKIYCLLCALLVTMSVYACGNMDENKVEKGIPNNGNYAEIENESDEADEQTVEKSVVLNPYFYDENQVVLKADAEYQVFESFIEKEVEITVSMVKKYSEGIVYKFSVNGLEDGEGLGEARENIYFYVTSEKIYRIWASTYLNESLITFYNDDEMLVKTFDTDEKLIENSEIVLQEKEIKVDENLIGKVGSHVSITKTDNRIKYSRVDIKQNEEIGFYEWFEWEKGKGLVDYGSGYRAEADILYLSNIEVSTENQ